MASSSYSPRRSYLYTDQSDEITGSSDEAQATPSGSFDEHRTHVRNGPRTLSSMSDLMIVLAKSVIHCRLDDQTVTLDSRAKLVGRGS